MIHVHYLIQHYLSEQDLIAAGVSPLIRLKVDKGVTSSDQTASNKTRLQWKCKDSIQSFFNDSWEIEFSDYSNLSL